MRERSRVTGFTMCENFSGDILVDISRTETAYAFMTPKGSIIISPKKKILI